MVPIIGAVTALVGKAIDKAFPDKGEANRLKAQIDTQLMNMGAEELKSATSVIIAEASGDSWLQKSWRPITMLTFVALIVAHWLGFTADNLTEEQILSLFDLVKVGLGGYVIGRSAEKGIKAWKQS